MTAAQRSIMSFLDLALITTGVMAMLASVGDRHSAAAGAISETFGAAPRSVVEHALPVSQLFEPQDARLSDAGTAALAELALASPTVEIGITVP
ncbi:hypothetical protein, partial [Blastomonas sp.]|uniref:hypothetical protein n=1 Tax=Blastomonas sp. TaxID=1909299 RepID=UPI003593F21C